MFLSNGTCVFVYIYFFSFFNIYIDYINTCITKKELLTDKQKPLNDLYFTLRKSSIQKQIFKKKMNIYGIVVRHTAK